MKHTRVKNKNSFIHHKKKKLPTHDGASKKMLFASTQLEKNLNAEISREIGLSFIR